MLAREDRDGICTLRLEHGKANALDLELSRALDSTLQELRGDPPRALVLTARDPMFCAGVDLRRVVGGGEDYVAEFLPALTRAITNLATLPFPVIAAVNGHAIAGGCILAATADHALAAEGSGTIGVPELLVGVPFPQIALAVIHARIGARHTRTLTLEGRALPFARAVDIGLVDECVPAAELLDRATATAHRLAAIPAASFAAHKRQLRGFAAIAEPIPASEILAIWRRPEVRAALAAFVERTLRR